MDLWLLTLICLLSPAWIYMIIKFGASGYFRAKEDHLARVIRSNKQQ